MSSDRPEWVDRIMPEQIRSMPPYVPGKPLEELERELGVTQAVKMASNENPLGPSPFAMEAVKEHLARTHIYPESSAPLLRGALASRYGLSPDSVIVGAGSDEILQFIAHVFMRPGDEAVIAEHTFSMYRITVQAFGGRILEVPLKGFGYDLSAMAKRVTDRTRLIFMAVPNNPTGVVVSDDQFRSFLADLPDEGLIVVLDEAYGEYVTDDDCVRGVDHIEGRPPVLVLRTFSKLYGLAGFRVGYGLGKPWMIELMNRVRPPFNVSSVAQAAAIAALGDTGHVERSLEINRTGMRLLREELSRMGLDPVPSQANFICFRVGADARRVYEGLLKEGVIVRHLASFGLGDCMRVTVGTDEQNSRFLQSLELVMERIGSRSVRGSSHAS